jgi:YesN/AraC family two-component response regulator
MDARSAADALQLARGFAGPIDLLLTDIVMPQKNGIDLSKELRAVRPEMKTLFMSGYTDNSVVNLGMLTTETPFIQKPFTVAALHRKVREVLAV